MSMTREVAIIIPVMKSTGLNNLRPKKVMISPPRRKTTNMGHLLLLNQVQRADICPFLQPVELAKVAVNEFPLEVS